MKPWNKRIFHFPVQNHLTTNVLISPPMNTKWLMQANHECIVGQLVLERKRVRASVGIFNRLEIVYTHPKFAQYRVSHLLQLCCSNHTKKTSFSQDSIATIQQILIRKHNKGPLPMASSFIFSCFAAANGSKRRIPFLA